MTFERSRLRGKEPGRRQLPAWAIVVASAVAGVGIPGRAQDEGVDTNRLVQLIDAGEYRAAVAEAKALEETVRPKAKDAAYVPRVRAAVDLLLTQGTLERRMGDLDAAETTLGTAFKTYTDREFQRRLALAARSAGEQAAAALVPYELVFVDLRWSSLDVIVNVRLVDVRVVEWCLVNVRLVDIRLVEWRLVDIRVVEWWLVWSVQHV